MISVPFEFVRGLALEFGCVECFWRESDRSFTGFVVEVWFESLPSDFAVRWSAVVGLLGQGSGAEGWCGSVYGFCSLGGSGW